MLCGMQRCKLGAYETFDAIHRDVLTTAMDVQSGMQSRLQRDPRGPLTHRLPSHQPFN